jgi:hypothetical protein
LGFTQRSRSNSGQVGSPQVGLWKDSESGYTDVRLDAAMGGVLLTVDARLRTELTSDGRSDFGSAAAFVRSGVQPLPLTPERFAKGESLQVTVQANIPAPLLDTASAAQSPAIGAGGSNEIVAKAPDEAISVKGSSVDLLEITLFSFFVDAVIDCDTTEGAKIKWADELRYALLGKEIDKGSALYNLRHVHKKFQRKAQDRFGDPASDYVAKPDGMMDIDNLKPFIAWFCELLSCALPEQCEPVSKYKILIDYCEAILGVVKDDKSFTATVKANDDPFAKLRSNYNLPKTLHPRKLHNAEDWHIRIRICIYSCLAILWAVHRRLVLYRRDGDISGVESKLLYRIEQILQHNYDQVWLSARDSVKGAQRMKA